MTSLQHLMSMGVVGNAQNNAGETLVTTENLVRLRGVPIFFFSGLENAIYSPELTDISYNALLGHFGRRSL